MDSISLREENYRSCFSPNLLPAAHEWCFRRFDSSIRRQCSIIVVDNTNSRLCEYRRYINRCNGTNYIVVVLEIVCHNRQLVRAFHQRNTHGGVCVHFSNHPIPLLFSHQQLLFWLVRFHSHPTVPFSTMTRMFDRWEFDPHAIRVTPFFN